MGKIGIILFGILLMLLAGFGVSKNLKDKERIAAFGDQEVQGRILYVTESKSDQGSTKCGFRYSFRTPDGKVFAGGHRGTEPELEYMRNGDPITVRYLADNPKQSTAFTASTEPRSMQHIEKSLKVCFGMAAFGLLATVLGFMCRPEVKPDPAQPGPTKFSDDPAGAAEVAQRMAFR